MSFFQELQNFELSLVTTAVEIFAARYISAVGYVILLWDTIITLPREIELIWKAPFSLAKLAYLANHYASLAVLTVLLCAFSGVSGIEPSNSFCLNATSIGLAGGVISLGVGNYLVLLQVWQLWDQKAIVRLILTCGWAISYCTTLFIACLVITEIPELIVPVPGFDICGLIGIPSTLRAIWASPIAFEVLVFTFTVWNGADRPRRSNESLTRSLHKDGILYFVSLSVLRIFNLVITMRAPTPLISVGSCLIWQCNIVFLNRLILNQKVPLPETRLDGWDAGIHDTDNKFPIHTETESFDMNVQRSFLSV